MKKFLVSVLSFAFVGLFLAGTLVGCKTDEKLASRIGLQYAVGKYIEKQSPENRVAKARAILDAVKVLEELAGKDSTTVDALRAYIAQRLDHLSPADRIAVGNLIDLAADALRQRVGDGVLKPDDVLIVRDVLSWVDEAASAYAPPSS